MFDPARTIQLINGALFDAQTTWQDYLEEADDWQKTAVLLTIPLIVLSALISYLLGMLTGSGFFGFRLMIYSMIGGVFSAALTSYIFSFFAGTFGGKRSFAFGLAALTLAAVPGYVGRALSTLPWIGWLLSIGLGIYTLVKIWRIIPLYLDVPEEKRVIHFIVSLIACVVAVMLISALSYRVLGINPASTMNQQISQTSSTQTSTTSGTGFFGGLVQQADLIATAEQDRYEPPGSGRLTGQQVETFIRVMDRTTEIAGERGERLQNLAESVDQQEQLSLSDLGSLMRGVNEASQLNTTEIEVVKSGGGNWAEHQWVKQTLRNAWLQQDANETTAHNYALYQEHEAALQAYIAR